MSEDEGMNISEEAARAVVDAWTIAGPVPSYHEAKKQELRRDWPALAQALDELARE
jgi:hypothetical protein